MLLRVAKKSGGSLHGRVEIGRRTDADPAFTLNPPSRGSPASKNNASRGPCN